ncbi:MAG: lipopolysaccharide heptosyltransferase II [Candidatus Omnitrophica bacterium]|nr:lipopolysaccharide heptosyltransferase II [Candidatus Omnitrophota bacterium]
MSRILIVNVNWLGDVLFSTPLIRALRQKFPGAYLASMVVPRCKEILELNPHLNELIIYDEDGGHKGVFGKIKLISFLRAKRFDTAILLHRSFTRALMLCLAGVPERIGYYTRKRSMLLTDAARIPLKEMHRVDFFLNLGRRLGVSSGQREYEFFISDKEKESARKFLRERGVNDSDTVIAVNPGGNWNPKRWPAEKFSRLADALGREFNAKIVITGAAKDLGLTEDISSRMAARPVVACGRTSLKELASIFALADLVIANDSGPMHIAVSQGADTIALFGPTSPNITGPIGRGRYIVLKEDTGCEIPCYNFSCAEYKCMEAIKVEDVVAAARKLLRSGNS